MKILNLNANYYSDKIRFSGTNKKGLSDEAAKVLSDDKIMADLQKIGLVSKEALSAVRSKYNLPNDTLSKESSEAPVERDHYDDDWDYYFFNGFPSYSDCCNSFI